MDYLALGPYKRDRIVLCSGDASPKAQREFPCEAGYFYPGAKWVGAMRNAAERLGCQFVIFAGPYGLVDPWTKIERYDVPGYTEQEKQMLKEKLVQTIPGLIGDNRYDLVVLYAGANPRALVIELMGPILKHNGIDLITFGKPNMFDIGKIDDFVALLIGGTTSNGLKSILRCPDRLQFVPK